MEDFYGNQSFRRAKVYIRMFYLTGETDIRWNAMNDSIVGPELTWSKVVEELKPKFYAIMIQ